jgi:acyl-CoA hydrolase
MRRILVLVVGILVTAAASAPALASSRDEGRPQPASCKHGVVSLSGPITAVGSTSITVRVLHAGPHDKRFLGRAVELSVTTETKIVRDGKPIGLRDLVVNEHVATTARDCRPRALADSGLVATSIHAGDREVALSGNITAVGADSVTLDVGHVVRIGEASIDRQAALAVTSDTKITRDGNPIALTDLVIGEHIGATAEAIGSDPVELTARTIRAADRELALAGKVTAVGSSSLTVDVDHVVRIGSATLDKQVTLQVTAATKITRDGKPIALSDLVVGEHVGATAEAIGTQLAARSIRAADRDVALSGTIASVGPTSVVVDVEHAVRIGAASYDREVTLMVVSSTQIFLDGKPAGIGDLASGQHVAASVEAITGQVTAKTIRARSVKPQRFTVSGTLVSVGTSSITLDKGTLSVAPSATIVLDGKPAGLPDLKPGDRVKAAGIVQNGVPTAMAIHAQSPRVRPLAPPKRGKGTTTPTTTTTTTTTTTASS